MTHNDNLKNTKSLDVNVILSDIDERYRQRLSKLTIDFAENDVECSNDGDDIGQHQVLADVVNQGQMGKTGSLDLASGIN